MMKARGTSSSPTAGGLRGAGAALQFDSIRVLFVGEIADQKYGAIRMIFV
jgi:hypothetical protein